MTLPDGAAVSSPSGLERVIRQDRVVVGFGIVAVAALAWLYLLREAAMMSAAAGEAEMHAAMGMPATTVWGGAQYVMLLTMWAVMMVAMMLPSAAPVMLLVAGTYRRRGKRARVLTTTFAAGYLLAWTAFSAVAAGTQFMLHRAAVLSPAMVVNSTLAGGAILIVAGVYQWLPIKGACLTHCRSPIAFLSESWREGTGGALSMGLKHGIYCVGCCWALMLLLFAAGVMNLFWVAVIAVVVLAEKLLPQGVHLGRIVGVLLVAWGVWVLSGGG